MTHDLLSLLNLHPPLHDAFGMTVMEAAAMATPSLIHNSEGALGSLYNKNMSTHCDFLSDLAIHTSLLYRRFVH